MAKMRASSFSGRPRGGVGVEDLRSDNESASGQCKPAGSHRPLAKKFVLLREHGTMRRIRQTRETGMLNSLWTLVSACFDTDDGSLPGIEITNLSPEGVSRIYAMLRTRSRLD